MPNLILNKLNTEVSTGESPKPTQAKKEGKSKYA